MKNLTRTLLAASFLTWLLVSPALSMDLVRQKAAVSPRTTWSS
ncbi:MAG: hypothetical protein ABI682_01385 [Acidobacteriota bacterium]